MTSASHPSDRSVNQLRERAENRVPKRRTDVLGMSTEEIERLVYELEVHQEELEIQNEELRRIHLELAASNDRFSDLYDFAPVGYLTIDEKGEILKANLTAATMLNRNRSSLLGSRLGFYCAQESRLKLNEHIEQVLLNRQGQSCELRFNSSDGSTFYAQLDSNFIESATENEFFCRVIITDISKRRLAELALAAKDEYLRALADAVPVLICYIDRELRFQFNNAAYRSWFGLSPSELEGREIGSVFGDNYVAEVNEYLTDVLTGRRVDFEIQLDHQKSGSRHVHVMLVPDCDLNDNVKGIHGLCIDITDRRVIEEQNARRRSFAERLVRLNSDERDVYELLIRGKSNKTVASELDIGLRTAERRRQIIFEKLEVETLAQLLQQLANIQGIDLV